MSTYKIRDFSAGWVPSDNAVGGRPNGLLRMDNLYLDDNGIVKLVPGLNRANQTALPGGVHTLYSQSFNGSKIRFAGLTDGTVIAAASDFSSSAPLIEEGNAEVAAFSPAFNWLFAASGRKVVRYNVSTVVPVGLHKPDKPTLTNNVGPVARVVEDYVAANVTQGTLVSATTDVQIDSTETGAAVEIAPTNSNTMVMSQDGVGRETDTVSMPVVIADSSKLVRVRLEFYMDDTNYYFYEWVQGAEKSPLNVGTDIASVCTARRGDFKRAGSDNGDWSAISKVRVSFETTGAMRVQAQRVSIFGGNAGTLRGAYQYRVQCIARAKTNGVTDYVAISPASDPSDVIYTHNNTVNVYLPNPPDGDYFVDGYWIFRRSAEISNDASPINEPRRLDQWYRVAALEEDSLPGQWEDTVSDDDALFEGRVLDEDTFSIAELQAEIVGLSKPVNGRLWYLTTSGVVPSLVDNPDAYSPFQEIKLGGNTTVKNLWIVAADKQIIVGTTEDVYVISGSFQTLANGLIDANVQALGLGKEFAPISRSHTYSGGSIYYISGSGWAKLSGTSIEPLVGELDFLFRKQERHGFPYVNLIPNGLAIYGVAIRGNQLWTSNVMSDGTRRIFIYDFARKYWHVRNLDPITLFAEEDGTILGGFGGGSGNYVNELDTGTDLAGINGQAFHMLTAFNNLDQPNNRKDAHTLVVFAKSDDTVSVQLAKDGGGFVELGQVNFGSSGSYKFFKLPNKINLGKTWALQIKGQDLGLFEFYNAEFEYDSRPPQLNYLRIPPTNLGTYSRKRFTSYAFVIDTLGQNATFTPYVDNVALDSTTINTPDKTTYIHYFTEEVVGTDITGIIESNSEQAPFEFYELNLEETVSEKLPTPVKYLVIPSTDYGEPNRKRHSSYKFQIHTRGRNVIFTPKIDGTFKSPITFSTSEKRTQAFYFTEDNIGLDIGGILESAEDTPFEFYGVIKPQQLEVFPPLLKEFRIPENNYGVPARKRIRTLPFKLNTMGGTVTFTPVVDGVRLAPSTHTTNEPQTLFHYFTTDVFGIDFSAELTSDTTFEFYGLLKPEEVQVLPVGKKFDQFGPIELPRNGKLLSFRIRMIAYDATVPVKVYVGDEEEYTFTLDTEIGKENVYEYMQFPKTIQGKVMRFEMGPTTEAFHRYNGDIKVNLSGMQTDAQWVKLK